jgi:polar amino acid transport system permease protein
MSEDLRSGLRSVGPGQREAALSIGLSRLQTLRLVLLPQALRAAVPPLVNQTLALFKATSLAMTVGAAELMNATIRMETETFRTFEVFTIASGCYLAVSWTIMAVGAFASRRIALARA